MANFIASFNRSVRKYPSVSMCRSMNSAPPVNGYDETAIPVIVTRSGPYPTLPKFRSVLGDRTILIDIAPKARFWSTGNKHPLGITLSHLLNFSMGGV